MLTGITNATSESLNRLANSRPAWPRYRHWPFGCCSTPVAIMQQQLENETTDRHEAVAPRFAVKSAVIEDDRHGQHVARLTIEQAGGATVSEVEVTARREGDVDGLLVNPHAFEPDYTTGAVVWKGSAPGMEHVLTASLEYNFWEPVNVVLDFVSRQADTGRDWKCTLTAVPRRPPPPPRRQMRRRILDEDY